MYIYIHIYVYMYVYTVPIHILIVNYHIRLHSIMLWYSIMLYKFISYDIALLLDCLLIAYAHDMGPKPITWTRQGSNCPMMGLAESCPFGAGSFQQDACHAQSRPMLWPLPHAMGTGSE